VAQNAMTVNNRSLSKAMEQLSTGKRINSASDDAAGMAITERMTSQIKGLNQAVKNGNDAISMLQTAEGSMIEVNSMLQRMRELSVSASTSTNSQSERNYMDQEFQELKSEISRVTKTTSWNGMAVLNADNSSASSMTQSFHVGASANDNEKISVSMKKLSTMTDGTTTAAVAQTTTGAAAVGTAAGTAEVSTLTLATAKLGDTVELTLGDSAVSYTLASADAETEYSAMATALTASSLGSSYTFAGSASGLAITEKTPSAGFTATAAVTLGKTLAVIGSSTDTQITNILSAANAKTNMVSIDNSLTEVNKERAKLGSVINRLTHTVDNLTNVSQNTSESRSRIQDTDYATATTELARTQIISQAATAMLAQANQASQSVLSLLK